MSPKELNYIEDALGHEQFFKNTMSRSCSKLTRSSAKTICAAIG